MTTNSCTAESGKEETPMEFTVILEECEEGGYTVTCPALPGCVTEGDTYEEALQNAREAIAGYLEAMEKQARWKVSNYNLATFL
jgi:predicted RNase H-like HicB family nuclease